MMEKLGVVLTCGLLLASGTVFANHTILPVKNTFFPIPWKIEATSRPDFVKVSNHTDKAQELFIYVSADSAPVEVYNCHAQDKNDLFANSSITCRVNAGDSIEWYIAKTLDSTHIGFIQGIYQLENKHGG